MGHGGVTVPSRFFPVAVRLLPVPRMSLLVIPGDSQFISEELNILILSRCSPGCSRSSPVKPRFIPVDPGSRTKAPPAS
ncbi:hypothetical protein DPMN_148168 [Dreissena polymorpha]|uniref:Uncharacterized protein n=1 Tax=Dreissena polymorpha TaxID=45954 RepID=A0A9D3Y3P0_DREPO|nr:hypothetical protein DPMN_190898 [Dreissena polymorpha]KAH3794631.1 hypothetical protein DPMN_148168 [Dreissena polymorpha]